MQIHPDVVALATAASTSCPSLHTASVLVRYGDALADAAATPAATGHVVVDLDEGEIADGVPAFAEFALKLVLNAITTGAHVRKGGSAGNARSVTRWHGALSSVDLCRAAAVGPAAPAVTARVPMSRRHRVPEPHD